MTRCKFDAIHMAKNEKEYYSDKLESLPFRAVGYAVKRAGKITAKGIKDAFVKK